jgi:hypothetical protein
MKQTCCYKKNTPSNLSVCNCDTNIFGCENNVNINISRQPDIKCGYEYYNKDVITDKYPRNEFVEVGNGFNSNDPRLIDVPRSFSMVLDSIPIDSNNLKLCQINTNPYLDNYGQNYKTYSDINAGNILYYNDKSIEDAFFGPNFVTSSNVDSYLYKDSMGSIKPHFKRVPLKCNDYLTSENRNYENCLSWMDDSTSFREDIMSLQMSKMNQQKWSSRWS